MTPEEHGSQGVSGGRRSAPFFVWLVAAMSAALAATSLIDYALTSGELQKQLVNSLVQTTESEGEALHQVVGTGRDDPGRVLATLDALTHTPYVVSAALLDARGCPLLQQTASDRGEQPGPGTACQESAAQPAQRPDPDASDVGTTGRPAVRQLSGLITVVVRVRAGDQPLALRVERSRDIVDVPIIRLKRRTLPIFVLIGLPIGVLVFSLTGGRKLAARHRRAVARSTSDALTGLGNRGAFRDDLDRAVTDTLARAAPFTLALMDIDNFKTINDTHGHRCGDEVLADVALLLRMRRATDRAFRIGGDEFALLLPDTSGEVAKQIATQIQQDLAARRPEATLSVGLATFDADVSDVTDLIDRADAALYAAKRGGRNRVVSYQSPRPGGDADRDLPGDVHALVRQQAVGVHFQPIWDLASGSVLGYEALARPAPDSGFVSPGAMFDAAARNGLTRAVDEICLARALERARERPTGARLFMNICPATLIDPLFQPGQLAERAEGEGIRPDQVVLEVTETGPVNSEVLLQRLAELRALGFLLALDDVGSGDTGMLLLQKVSVDYLKVDRSIVAAAAFSTTTRGVLSALLAYAAETDSYVVAEGIETSEMLHFVQRLRLRSPSVRVSGVQGFHLGRPQGGFPAVKPPSALPKPAPAD